MFKRNAATKPIIIIGLVWIVLLSELRAQTQPPQEITFKKQYYRPRVPDPLEIFNLQINGKSLAFGEKFVAENEWANSFNFDVRNSSAKTITFFRVDLLLSVPGKPRGVVTMMQHGQDASRKGVRPTIKLLPGETVHVAFTDNGLKSFASMAKHLEEAHINEVSLEIVHVLFEDDTLWGQGRIHQRADFNPSAWQAVDEEYPSRPPSAKPVNKVEPAGSAIIEVSPQPDAPLLISLSGAIANDPMKPQISYQVENIGNKPVRAYAIRRDAEAGETTNSGLTFGMAYVLDWVMQRGQWQGAISKFEGMGQPPERITLSLDFVEFEDGTTWGADHFKSAERLAIRRYGAKQERARLLQILATGGEEALIQSLQPPAAGVANTPLLEPAQSQRVGIQMLRNHLLLVYKNEGASFLLEALNNPPLHLIK
jgi:hypothetical protein